MSLDAVAGEAFPTGTLQEIEPRREDARKGLAYVIVGSFAFIVVASFVSLWARGKTPVEDIVKLIEAVLSPVVGIVGAVTGFYFGASQARNSTTPPHSR